MESFTIQSSVRAAPRADHMSHLEGVSLTIWKSTSCERAGKLSDGGHNLSCRGLNFVPPDGAYLLLENTKNITEAIQILSPLL